MNEWGWLGCIKNRDTILGWLEAEAKKAGYEDVKGVRGLLSAAWKEVRAKKKALDKLARNA